MDRALIKTPCFSTQGGCSTMPLVKIICYKQNKKTSFLSRLEVR